MLGVGRRRKQRNLDLFQSERSLSPPNKRKDAKPPTLPPSQRRKENLLHLLLGFYGTAEKAGVSGIVDWSFPSFWRTSTGANTTFEKSLRLCVDFRGQRLPGTRPFPSVGGQEKAPCDAGGNRYRISGAIRCWRASRRPRRRSWRRPRPSGRRLPSRSRSSRAR